MHGHVYKSAKSPLKYVSFRANCRAGTHILGKFYWMTSWPLNFCPVRVIRADIFMMIAG